MAKKKQKEQLSNDDHKLLASMIEASLKRGAIEANEMTTFGYMYDKLKRIDGDN